MLATPPALARGFLGRTIDELARRSNIAWKLEAVKGPQGPRPLYDFGSRDVVDDCIVMSDYHIGGQSTSHLDFISPTTPTDTPSSTISGTAPGYARFHGTISTALPPDKPSIARTGYAAFRTPDQQPTLFGRSLWDIDPYAYLALRIKSDGRSYMVNVQTEGVEPTDLHQHRLFARRPGEWETVLVGWNDFVRTNYGFVVEPQTELLRQKVKTIGIGLTDRVEGPFALCIERIWATNQVEDGATVLGSEPESPSASNPSLRTKTGKAVKW